MNIINSIEYCACILLNKSYQQQGENPEAKVKWAIMNPQQLAQEGLSNAGEIVVGPGRLTDPKVQSLALRSHYMVQLLDSVFVAIDKRLLQFQQIKELISQSNPNPSKTYNFETILALYAYDEYLIILMEKKVEIHRLNKNVLQQVFTQEVKSDQIQQISISKHSVLICCPTESHQINILTKLTSHHPKSALAGCINEAGNLVFLQSDRIELQDKSIPYSGDMEGYNQIFQAGEYFLVCGYHEDQDESDDLIYEACLDWVGSNGKRISSSNLSLKVNTKKENDFDIKHLENDVVMVYGSNLEQITFWKHGTRLPSFAQDPLVLNLDAALRGVVQLRLTESLGLSVNDGSQIKQMCVTRNRTIITLDKKGVLNQYEFLDFKHMKHYQPSNGNQPVGERLSIPLQDPPKIFQQTRLLIAECWPKELNKLKEDPYYLEVDQNQLITARGTFKGEFKEIGQHFNPSANIWVNYMQFQVLGCGRTLSLFDVNTLEYVLLGKSYEEVKIVIAESGHHIVCLQAVNEGLIVATNHEVIFVKISPKGHLEKTIPILKVGDVRKIEVFQNSILLQQRAKAMLVEMQSPQKPKFGAMNLNAISQLTFDQMANQKQNHSQDYTFKLMSEFRADASTFYPDAASMRVGILIIRDKNIFYSTEIPHFEQVQIDQLKLLNADYYFIHHLYNTKVYVSFVNVNRNKLFQTIIDFRIMRTIPALEEVLLDVNVNDIKEQMSDLDWVVRKIEIQDTMLVALFCSFSQDGFIFQAADENLVPLEIDRKCFKFPCYANIVKGLSFLEYVLPQEPQNALGKVVYNGCEYPMRLYPSVLLIEYDDVDTLSLHRYLITRERPQSQEKPLLKQATNFAEPAPKPEAIPDIIKPKSIMDNLLQQISQYLRESNRQLSGEEHILFEPKISLFLPKVFFSELRKKAERGRKEFERLMDLSNKAQSKENKALFDSLRKYLKQLKPRKKESEYFHKINEWISQTERSLRLLRYVVDEPSEQFQLQSRLSSQKARKGRCITFTDADVKAKPSLGEEEIEQLASRAQYGKVVYVKLFKKQNLTDSSSVTSQNQKQLVGDLNVGGFDLPQKQSTFSFNQPDDSSQKHDQRSQDQSSLSNQLSGSIPRTQKFNDLIGSAEKPKPGERSQKKPFEGPQKRQEPKNSFGGNSFNFDKSTAPQTTLFKDQGQSGPLMNSGSLLFSGQALDLGMQKLSFNEQSNQFLGFQIGNQPNEGEKQRKGPDQFQTQFEAPDLQPADLSGNFSASQREQKSQKPATKPPEAQPNLDSSRPPAAPQQQTSTSQPRQAAPISQLQQQASSAQPPQQNSTGQPQQSTPEGVRQLQTQAAQQQDQTQTGQPLQQATEGQPQQQAPAPQPQQQAPAVSSQPSNLSAYPASQPSAQNTIAQTQSTPQNSSFQPQAMLFGSNTDQQNQEKQSTLSLLQESTGQNQSSVFGTMNPSNEQAPSALPLNRTISATMSAGFSGQNPSPLTGPFIQSSGFGLFQSQQTGTGLSGATGFFGAATNQQQNSAIGIATSSGFGAQSSIFNQANTNKQPMQQMQLHFGTGNTANPLSSIGGTSFLPGFQSQPFNFQGDMGQPRK